MNCPVCGDGGRKYPCIHWEQRRRETKFETENERTDPTIPADDSVYADA